MLKKKNGPHQNNLKKKNMENNPDTENLPNKCMHN